MGGLTFNFIIKGLIFLGGSIIYLYFFGYYINMFFKKNSEHGIQNIAIGFICLLGIIHATTWFLVSFSLPFFIFYIQVNAIIIISIVFCIIMRKNNLYRKVSFNLFKFSKEEKIVAVIFIGIFLLQIVMTYLRYRSDSDDSFYVSNSAMFLSEKILNVYDSSMGNRSVPPLTMYDFEIWEAFLAFLSKIISVEPVVLSHTLIIPILLSCSMAAYVALGKKIFNKSIYVKMFYIIISIFHLMGGFSVFSQGSFLLSRIWQGKAVYLNVVLPFFMVWMLDLYEDSNNKMNYIKVTICILAGLALNPTSMYVLGFQMLAMFIVICVKKGSIKIIRYSLPSIMLYIVFTSLLYIRTSQYPDYITQVSKVDMNMIYTTFIQFWGDGLSYFIIYLISVAVIGKFGGDNAKILFTYTPGILFLCVWNPLIGQVIAEKITKAPAFWRVFWLVPVGTSVAYAMILIIEKSKIKGSKIIYLLLAFMIVFSWPGKWMFSENNKFIEATNIEKMPDVALKFGKMISEQGDDSSNITLAPSIFNTTLRQKYTNIELSTSRYLYELYYFRGEKDIFAEKSSLNNFVEGIQEDNYSEIIKLLDKYSIKWVIIRNERTKAIDFLCQNNYSIITEADDYILLKK